MISILIAARNEEDTILTCLQSIAQLNFPEDQWEVWIGDDASEDRTYEQVAAFISGKPQFHLARITETLGQARGKANVLAHLARYATGEQFLITDADVTVPNDWVQIMLAACEPEVGVVTGVTIPQAHNTWTAMQALEWTYALFVIHLLAKCNVPVTAMGNNMLVTRQSYESTGGYETISFSITEDFQLFREVQTRGYQFRHVYSREAMAVTVPMTTLKAWLHQRKRWAYGALQLRGLARLLMLSPILFMLLLVALCFVQPTAALLFTLLLVAVQVALVVGGLHRLRLTHLYIYVWLFPLYSYFSVLATLLYYYLPTKTIWKGRVYE